MTVLELRPGAIRNPKRFDLADVEAMMMWPGDVSARALWRLAVEIAEGRPLIDQMSSDDLRQFAKNAIDYPQARLEHLQAAASKQRINGGIAGSIVLEATFLAHLDPSKAALGKVHEWMSKALIRSKYQMAPQTMINKNGPIYPFRPVAHFYAARSLSIIDDDDFTFPCRFADLARFLATAEAIRRLAETSRAPRSNATVMRPGEAVTLPDNILDQLPEMPLEIDPPRFTENTPQIR